MTSILLFDKSSSMTDWGSLILMFRSNKRHAGLARQRRIKSGIQKVMNTLDSGLRRNDSRKIFQSIYVSQHYILLFVE